MHPLDGVWAKLERADDHLNVLGMKWQEFLGSDPCPYGFPVEEDAEGLRYTIRVKVHAEPPPLLSAVVGDILHNYRSALDQLAWQLVIAAGGKPSGNTAFPICDTESDWRRKTEYRRRANDRAGPLSGIPPGSEIWAFIEDAQPYKRGPTAEHLSTLRLLSNRDKHRALLARGAFPDIDSLAAIIHRHPDAVLISQDFTLKPGQPLVDGAVVATLRFAPGTRADVDVHGELGLDPAFSDDTWGADRGPSLLEVRSHLSEYIQEAARFFP